MKTISKTISIVLLSLVALSTTVQASHDLIKQPEVSELPEHYDVHDLKHWLTNYPLVNLTLVDGVATLTGHIGSQYDVEKIVRQVEKTAGVRRVANLISVD